MGGGDSSPKETYYEALGWFNSNQEVYLNYYDACSPACQAELKEDMDPIFERASHALDLWKLALGASTEQDKITAWLAMKNQLIVELIALEVI